MTLTQHAPHLLTSYRPLPGSYDELLDGDGAIREQWSHVGAALAELGHDELLRRQFDVDRLLDADGVSYNAFGANDPRGRRWALDPIPVVLSSQEWANIESGVIQRAELLDLILADLYGPRDLIRRGLVFLTHRRPDIGVDRVGPTNGLDGIGQAPQRTPDAAEPLDAGGHGRGEFEPGGSGDADMRAEHDGRLRE